MREQVLARLVPLVERYAQGRAASKSLRRAMRAARCTTREGRGGRCYMLHPGVAAHPGDCEPCKARRLLWQAFSGQLQEDRRLLGRIERLALRLSVPDPVEPEDPKPLLDLMGAADGRP